MEAGCPSGQKSGVGQGQGRSRRWAGVEAAKGGPKPVRRPPHYTECAQGPGSVREMLVTQQPGKTLASPGSLPLPACLTGPPAGALLLLPEVEVPSPGPQGAWLPLRGASSQQGIGRPPKPFSGLGSQLQGSLSHLWRTEERGAHPLHFSQVSLVQGLSPPHLFLPLLSLILLFSISFLSI